MPSPVLTTLSLELKPELADRFLATFAESVPATREHEGCRQVVGYRDMDEPNRFVLIGEWDSREHYERYLAWRAGQSDASSGGNDQVDPMLNPPKVRFWERLDA